MTQEQEIKEGTWQWHEMRARAYERMAREATRDSLVESFRTSAMSEQNKADRLKGTR